MPPHDEEEITRLLKENTELVRENNRILKKMRRNAVIELWVRVVWYAFLIGVPFLLYFYLLGPYLAAFGIHQFPGLKTFQSLFEAYQK